MVKRKRNSIGQFIASGCVDKKTVFTNENLQQKIMNIFMVLLFLLMVSPWLTLAIKSKTLQIWINSIFYFYEKHFIGEDEINGTCKCPNPPTDI